MLAKFNEDFPDIYGMAGGLKKKMNSDAVEAIKAGNYKLARVQLIHSMFFDMYYYDSLLKLGYLAAMEEDFSNAVLFFKRSIEASPDGLDAHFNLSLAYQLSGSAEKARAAMRRYLALGGRPTFETRDILGNQF